MFNINSEEAMLLLRLVVNGKFFTSQTDDVIMSSPIAAELSRKICAVAENYELEKYGDLGRESFCAWKNINDTREEWHVALKFARKAFGRQWDWYDGDKKMNIIKDTFAPFVLSLDDVKKFSALVNLDQD